ncbi:MAG: aminoglycoside phosphotransferase (APT) family kinase protein [Myxococcota bacterium]|jgi:aminoglycoside phosphotransferase (APT) family kinase protein
MHDLIDRPADVRADDRLDVGAVTRWLDGRMPGVTGEPRVKQYRGGASNLTYLLEWPDHSVVLRRPPFGTKAASAHDMGREVRALTALEGRFPVPRVLAHCADPSVAGGEFYVMERLEGIILRRDIPAGLGLDARDTRALCERVLDLLVSLHSLDPEAEGLTHLGRGAGYGRRQIDGWSRRYRAALTPGAADGERVMAWLDANCRDDAASRVIHGDFRFDNIVLDPADPMRILGVLDWEMATLGDPLMDLGNSLAYWVEADDDAFLQAMRRQPTNAPGMLTRAEVWQGYAAAAGVQLTDTDFYEVYGLFRLAGILQQIWYRYHHGQTTNPAFASFGAAAAYMVGRCEQIVARH